MKILFITNLAPQENKTFSGIFVVKRLQQLKRFDISYEAVPLVFTYSKLFSLLERLLKRDISEPLKKFEGVHFRTGILEWDLSSSLKFRLQRDYYKSLVLSCVNRIEQLVGVSTFDLIHAHGMYNVPAGMAAQALAERYQKPFVVTLHGSDVNILMPKRKQEYSAALESASKVISVSNAVLEKAKTYGYSGKNAVVIPNGYDPEVFKPMDKEIVRKKLNIHKEGYKYVGFVGSLKPIKRADKLGKIFHLIAKEIPNTMFIVVGEGPLKEKIEKEAKDLNVIFTGKLPQKDVGRWMNAMDVMVLPSRNEGWPCVVLEAQACGTCVVGSDNGGIPEAIGFEEYVVKEEKDFEKRFAEKTIRALKDGYDREVFINRAREFSWNKIVEREIAIYSRVV